MDATVRAEMRRVHLDKGTGRVRVPRLDAHGYYTRAMMAALLALLEGRGHVTEDDWRLSGVMWEMSCRVRDNLARRGQQIRDQADQQKDRHYAAREGMAEGARQAVRLGEEGSTVLRLARLLAEHVHEADGMTLGQARQKLASRDRKHWAGALDLAQAEGWVMAEDDRLIPGERSRPA